MFFFNFKYQKCKYDTTAAIYLCQSITNVLYKYGAKDWNGKQHILYQKVYRKKTKKHNSWFLIF